MGRPRHSSAALEGPEAQAVILTALRHALRCRDPDCTECLRMRGVLEGGPPSVLSVGVELAAKAAMKDEIEARALAVVEAVSDARTCPTNSLRRALVEDAMQALAKTLGEKLPPPSGSLR